MLIKSKSNVLETLDEKLCCASKQQSSKAQEGDRNSYLIDDDGKRQ